MNQVENATYWRNHKDFVEVGSAEGDIPLIKASKSGTGGRFGTSHLQNCWRLPEKYPAEKPNTMKLKGFYIAGYCPSMRVGNSNGEGEKTFLFEGAEELKGKNDRPLSCSQAEHLRRIGSSGR